ncbi:hypothetical protein PFISCL1PPCAC_19133, partial [Pristionchus fissidentatus]
PLIASGQLSLPRSSSLTLLAITHPPHAMSFWNFHQQIPLFWNGRGQVGRDASAAGAAVGLPQFGPSGQPAQQLQQQRNNNNTGAAPSSGRRRRYNRGRLRSPSDTSTFPEKDLTGDSLRLSLADEIDDRFSRLRSNQKFAPTTKRTGHVQFEAMPSLMDERVATEKAIVDRYVKILECAVKEGIEDWDLAETEHEMLHELRLWKDRVKAEKLDNSDLRAYLLARRESLCGVHATLRSALEEVKSARDRVVG